jgi:hypothetical protein
MSPSGILPGAYRLSQRATVKAGGKNVAEAVAEDPLVALKKRLPGAFGNVVAAVKHAREGLQLLATVRERHDVLSGDLPACELGHEIGPIFEEPARRSVWHVDEAQIGLVDVELARAGNFHTPDMVEKHHQSRNLLSIQHDLFANRVSGLRAPPLDM